MSDEWDDVFNTWTSEELRVYIQDNGGHRPSLSTSHTELVRGAVNYAKKVAAEAEATYSQSSGGNSGNIAYQHNNSSNYSAHSGGSSGQYSTPVYDHQYPAPLYEHPSPSYSSQALPPAHHQPPSNTTAQNGHYNNMYYHPAQASTSNHGAAPYVVPSNNGEGRVLQCYAPIAPSPLLQQAYAPQTNGSGGNGGGFNWAPVTPQTTYQGIQAPQGHHPSPFEQAAQQQSDHTYSRLTSRPSGNANQLGASMQKLSMYSPNGSGQSSGGMAGRPSSSGGTDRLSMKASLERWECDWNDIQLIRQIGHGSFGNVHLAKYRECKVAVKILFKEDTASCTTTDRFTWSEPMLQELLSEASLMANLRHPNIVSFMAICTEPKAAIITEFCSNGSLKDVLQKASKDKEFAKTFTWERRLRMLKGAAKGLHYLHTSRPPIIHRDLKSPNLLVDENWNVKICDFNLSRIAEGSGKGGSTMAEMNPRWLSAEVIRGERATTKSDTYSFGMIMYEILAWEIPFRKKSNLWSISDAILKGERPEVPELAKLPRPIFVGVGQYKKLMNACWHQDPDSRPDMQQVIQELRELQKFL